MFNSISRYNVFLVASALILILTGCSSPAKREAMIPQGVASKNYPHSLSVQTSGGSETGAMDSSNISDTNLKAAIEDAVVQSKLFASIIQLTSGDYQLSVRIINLSKPVFGATFTVDMETAWSLIKTADNSVVMRKSVKTSGKANIGDAFVAAVRLRLAVENAARENISQGLHAIAELNL